VGGTKATSQILAANTLLLLTIAAGDVPDSDLNRRIDLLSAKIESLGTLIASSFQEMNVSLESLLSKIEAAKS
jgi:hypothetical protein